MKICVYTISKNEEKHVQRWVESAKEADLLLVLDTGSTDNTVKLLKEHNVSTTVKEFKPFRFDHARQAALDLIPEDFDICVSLDMDEILTPGWREKIEKLWVGGVNRLYYGYIWAFDENGRPLSQFLCEKIHGRNSHTWELPVHEILKAKNEEIFATCNDVIIEHHADNLKSRSQYLNLLEMSVIEQPDNDRNSHYLGREYFFYRRYEDAILELSRHLNLSSAVWKPERSASMRYIAQCYECIGRDLNAENWYLKAMLEDFSSKEAIIYLAKYYLKTKQYALALGYALKSNNLVGDGSYILETYCQKEGAYDIASVASFYMKLYLDSAYYAALALEQNPTDARLKTNLDLIQNFNEIKNG